MYEKFFGFKKEPFGASPDPQFLYPGAQHQEALARLSYGVASHKGIIALTGGCGTGKTVLVTTLLKGFNSNVVSAWVVNSTLSPADLVKYVCFDFKLALKNFEIGQMLLTLYRFLMRNYEQGRNAVLIIDDAHNLAPETLYQVRQMSNLETVKRKLLQIILVGPPKLERILEQDATGQLGQRVAIRARLGRLNATETRAYILHRLRTASGSEAIFEPKVFQPIFALSEGIPRLINSVCDSALLSAYREGKSMVDLTIIERMVQNSLVNAITHPPGPAEIDLMTESRFTASAQKGLDHAKGFDALFEKLDMCLLNLN